MSNGVFELPDDAIQEADAVELTPEKILLLVDLIFMNHDPSKDLPS